MRLTSIEEKSKIDITNRYPSPRNSTSKPVPAEVTAKASLKIIKQ